ncbi:hypothetical protein PR048_020107 [Dryococelus australis]|uniref:Mutator-like transposase domain-containing protein n=1 Tax=Dryococelus australis TaxID=614101 RepID=A0ABQ9H5C9_9NEOP|nr:hypothetical protein PR048_020107 [Dryococelus australis]
MINTINDINDSAVWGALSTGIGYSQLEEMFAIMDVPVKSSKKFKKHKIAIEQVGNNQAWEEHLTTKIKLAGSQEKRIAEEKGH